MCEDCGCSQANHTHAVGHHHHDDHTHEHDHDASGRTILLEQKILSRNDEIAAQNRTWLAERGVVAVNMISSPGSGKTFLLERTLERLRGKLGCAVITGDQQTQNDAKRLEGKGAVVKQIETISSCHLDAEQIARLLPETIGSDTKLLFIENVGNLVCPSAFDLGEHFKIALLSTAEGEDKPVKYPSLFTQAPVAVLTKMDLAPHLDWDIAVCRQHLRSVRPGVFIFELSAKTGEGMDAWIDYLQGLVAGN
ncbi:MAG: hydrogenase nickel incorporation protein HypB [Verrucomicrobia bacterium]|jgi:hydrogenase nickel incorporation protein HypB|nr:hydrogenase nickel incorporation protein HypB [Verrucomicrobiota bacterium]